jgi:hypothetical protein
MPLLSQPRTFLLPTFTNNNIADMHMRDELTPVTLNTGSSNYVLKRILKNMQLLLKYFLQNEK